jgi:prolyl-tRNA synthetase
LAGNEGGSGKEIFNIDKSDFSRWYSEILKTADLVDLRYSVKGFIVYRPWLMRMAKALYANWESELEKRGHSPTLFPVVIPEENFEKEKDHVVGFSPQVFWVTEAGEGPLENRLALRPTSEAAFYQMYPLWIRSHTDLPLRLYQSCAVYRYETKATKPLVRGREFLWIEAHDVFTTEEAALDQVRADMETTKAVYDGLGIPVMFLRRPAFDKFAGAVDTYAADALMPDLKVVQLPSTHYLGQGFARAFGISFEDEEGSKRIPHQTCYGPPISRTLAVMAAIHGDRKGLVLPMAVAPVQVVIVPIVYKGKGADVIDASRDLARRLEKAGFRVRVDDSDRKPGVKFYYWEMKGVPLRIEIGPRDLESGTVVLVRRDTGKKEKVHNSQAVKAVGKAGKLVLESLGARARENLESHLSEADSMEELAGILTEKGGFVKVPFCSREMEGEACAERIKDETEGEVRGTIFGKEEKPEGMSCIACGKPAGSIVLVARAY